MIIKDRKSDFWPYSLHLGILFCLGIAQALFAVLSRNPEFFVARRSKPEDILLLAILLCFVLPMGLVLIEGIALIVSKKLQMSIHGLFMTMLLSCMIVPLLDSMKTITDFRVMAEDFWKGFRKSDEIFLALLLIVVLIVLYLIFRFVFSRVRPWFRESRNRFSVAVLVCIVLLPVWKEVIQGFAGTVTLFLGILLSADLMMRYFRSSTARNLLTFLSPIMVFVPFLFLMNPSISKVRSAEQEELPSIKLNSPKSVVMIVFDEFPLASLLDEDQNIDPIRYPNFASFGRAGTWYRHATTVAEYTDLAVPAILTGNYPDPSRLPTLHDYPQNLFTLLARSYDLNVNEMITHLCPDPMLIHEPGTSLFRRMILMLEDVSAICLRLVLPAQISDGLGLPSVTQTWGNFWNTESKEFDAKKMQGSRDRGALFRSFVASIGHHAKPSLYYFHAELPHFPFQYVRSGKSYDWRSFGLMGLDGLQHNDVWQQEDWPVMQAYQHHLLQVGYVDSLLGTLIRRLKDSQLYDNSLIILVADHGISFRPGQPRRSTTKENFADILPIPLLIKFPNQRQGTIDDQYVEIIDILPTIADVLQANLNWKMDGSSLLKNYKQRPQRRVLRFGGKVDQMTWMLFQSEVEPLKMAVARKTNWFGSGKEENIYRIGPDAKWIGERVNKFIVEGNADFAVKLRFPNALDDVDLNSDVIPVFLCGYVVKSNKSRSGIPMGIVLDGTFVAVTQTITVPSFPYGNPVQGFRAIMPESALRFGKNRLEIFVLPQGERNGILSVPVL